MSDLNHLNQRGEVHMVDVGDKTASQRRAVAEGWIRMRPETLETLVTQSHNKGDVLAVARVAGIMASKKTAELIPLCHPIALSHVDIVLEPDVERSVVVCRATVETRGVTGVEMEALTAVAAGLLTIYDMLKAVDRGMTMHDLRLEEKRGGKSGTFRRK